MPGRGPSYGSKKPAHCPLTRARTGFPTPERLLMEQNRGHQCRPLLIAGRGAIATCSAHYGKPVGVTAAPQPGGH